MRGRPRIDKVDRKDHGLKLRLSEKEKEKLELIADNEGISMSAFLRRKINEEYNQMLGYGVKGRTWL